MHDEARGLVHHHEVAVLIDNVERDRFPARARGRGRGTRDAVALARFDPQGGLQ